jgi:DNA-binding HxlR family transcriptional regulator
VLRVKSVRNGELLTFWSKLATMLKKKTSIRASKTPRAAPPVARMVEDIVGCKWSLTVLELLVQGVSRPGAMQRRVSGLTAKVLNERLRKLLRFGIIDREIFAEVPPRVEYRLTTFGKRFSGVLEQIAVLEAER